MSELSAELKAAAEAAAGEYADAIVSSSHPMHRSCSLAHKAGVEWLYTHLLSSAGEFDEKACFIEWNKNDCGVPYSTFYNGARWQHQQQAARVSAYRESTHLMAATNIKQDAEIARLKADLAHEMRMRERDELERK